jgi:hypothetical protein
VLDGLAVLPLDGVLEDMRQPEPAEMAAPLLVVPLACKAAYLDRYAEPDKGWTDREEGR